jgi:hypothetical protein
MTARERIADLTVHESNSVAQFSAAAYGGLRTPREKLQAANTLLRIEPNGRLAEFRGWGIYVAGLPVLWQLTVQPSLIVDVWPMSHDDFKACYGIRPDQFAQLAQERFIIPNLYHYDSDKATDFARHEAFSDVLMPILAFEQTHCRINSIRRAPLLQALAGSAFNKFVEKGKELFEPGLSSLTSNQRKELTRSDDLPGALQKVASNWAYVIALRGQDEWTEKITQNGVGDVQADLRRLTARYSAAVAPYTAAFGGTHLVPPRQIDALRNEGGVLQFVSGAERRLFERERWPGLQALMEVGLIRYTLGTPVPEQTIEPPAVPEDKHFDNFLAFLLDTKDRRNQMQSFLIDAQRVSADLQLTLKHWTNYFKLYEELKSEEERLRRQGLWVGVGAAGGGGMLGALAGSFPLGEVPITRRAFGMHSALVGAALGALIFGGASSLASDLLRPQSPEPYRKLIGRFEDFERWQNEVVSTNS